MRQGLLLPVAPDLAERLKLAAAFRNHLVHGYEELELALAWRAMTAGLEDVRGLLRCVRDAAGARA